MLEITGKHIAALSDTDLRELIGRLCEAEVRGCSLSTSHVTYGGAQDAPDGGLDVRVEIPPEHRIEGYIPRPTTGFQVKATAMRPAKIKAEMRPNDTVRPVIMELADNSGSYILITSKESTGDKQLPHRIQAMRDAIRDLANHDRLQVGFYDQKKIASWLRSHPGIIPWVRQSIGQPIRGWSSYGNWSNSPAGVPNDFLHDDQARIRVRSNSNDKEVSVLEGIRQMRETLSQPHGIVRLVGLSGVGKTRLVQALFEDSIGSSALPQSRVLYTDPSRNPDPPPQDLIQHLQASRDAAILVVDNCPQDLHKRLSQAVLASAESIALLTVEYDVRGDDLPEDTEVFELRSSSRSLMEALLERRFPTLSHVNIQTIVNMAEGNARMALALAKGVGNRRGIARLSEEDLFQRLFWQRNSPNDDLLASAQVLSLVYSFDGKDVSPTSELALLGSLIKKSPEEMHSQVANLLDRDLIQQRSQWRALLPHAIANRLAARALKYFPEGRLQRFFVEEASPRLLKSFSRRLHYLHESPIATSIAVSWLSPDGIFGDFSNLSDLGCEVFRNIAPVEPEAALSAIERTISKNGVEGLTYAGIYASTLRSIAWDAKLFERCALAMSHFARRDSPAAEWNTEGKMLVSLFKLQLSGTHATIEQRLSVVERLIAAGGTSSDLGLEALQAALEAWHFSSYYNFNFGSRERDYGFFPSKLDDVKHWYASTLNLCKRLSRQNANLKPQIKTAVAEQLRALCAMECIFDEVGQFCRACAAEEFWAEGWRTVQTALYYDGRGMKSEVRQFLESLKQALAPRQLVEEVRGIVFSETYNLFSLGGHYEDGRDLMAQMANVENLAQALGAAVASDSEAFRQLLPEIVKATGRIGAFAWGLADGAHDPLVLWQSLVDQFCATQEHLRQTVCLHAYLVRLTVLKPQLVGEILDQAVEHPVLGRSFPLLQCSVGSNTKRFQRLLKSLSLGLADASAYRYLECGGTGNRFTASEFKELVLQVAAKPGGFAVAAENLSMRLTHGEDRGKDSEGEVLNAGRLLLAGMKEIPSGNRIDLELGQIVRSCLIEESDAALAGQLSRRLLDSISNYQRSDHDQVISALFRAQPVAILDEFATTVAKNPRHGMWVLRHVEGLAVNGMNTLADNSILSWCEQEPSVRYPIAATAIPLVTSVPQGQTPEWSPSAIELLKRAPDKAAVLRQFIDRQQPSVYMGSIIDIFQRTMKLLDKLTNGFNDESILRAIEQQKAALMERIASHEKIEFPEAETSFE